MKIFNGVCCGHSRDSNCKAKYLSSSLCARYYSRNLTPLMSFNPPNSPMRRCYPCPFLSIRKLIKDIERLTSRRGIEYDVGDGLEVRGRSQSGHCRSPVKIVTQGGEEKK